MVLLEFKNHDTKILEVSMILSKPCLYVSVNKYVYVNI